MKYSKWKAVEIDRCIKNGITPTPGPPGEQLFDDESDPSPPVGFNVQPPPSDFNTPGPSWPDATPVIPTDTKPTPKPRHAVSRDDYGIEAGSGGAGVSGQSTGVQLGPGEISRAQKLCNFARSALEYDDVQGAMEYLAKAMKLLQTGKEEG